MLGPEMTRDNMCVSRVGCKRLVKRQSDKQMDKRTFAFGTGETTAAKDLDCDFDFVSAERHILNVDVANDDGRDSAIQRADRHNLSMTAAYGGCLSGGQAACLLPPYPSTLEQFQVKLRSTRPRKSAGSKNVPFDASGSWRLRTKPPSPDN